jgi:hypothetical protein
MSLINDALKKAQKQRTGEAPSLGSLPSVGGESPQRIAKRAKPAGFDTLIIRAGVGAGDRAAARSWRLLRFPQRSRGQGSEDTKQPNTNRLDPFSCGHSDVACSVPGPPSSVLPAGFSGSRLHPSRCSDSEDRRQRTENSSDLRTDLRPPSSVL